jgi:L-aspartate semialdehyde sulfurtransferase ferredoxin
MPVRRWHLTFPEELVQKPIVYRLVCDHELVINIRRADIDVNFGWIVLEVEGAADRLEAAKVYLETAGVVVSDPGGDVMSG